MDNSNNSAEQLWWARAQTIATFVGLGVFVLQIWTLLYDRLIRAKALGPGKKASDQGEIGYFRVPKLSWWLAFRGFITETPKLTTIRGLIEAGDEYLWTSAALDHLQPHHGNLSWVSLYEAVYSQVAKQDSPKVQTQQTDNIITTVIQQNDTQIPGTSNKRYELYSEGKLVLCMRSIDKVEDVPLPHAGRNRISGLMNIAEAWMLRGSPCVDCSREELAALALILGIPLKINDYTQNVSGVGPFGTGFDMIQDSGVWRLELIHGSRLPRHAASRSSGYSILFAKHLPFSSLPFAENKLWVRSIYITPVVLGAIKTGRAIKDGKSFGGKPLQILRSLPAAKQIDAFYHTGTVDLDQDKLGSILNSDGKSVAIQVDKSTTVPANWCRAVAGIAFGRLVPQASKNLATAVTYTLAGEVFGDIVGDLVDALENLINRLHNCDPEANLFGDHVTEGCYALHLIEYVHYATPSRYNTQEAAAIFSRVMNLLERMVHLSNLSVERIFEESSFLIHSIYVLVIERRRGQNSPAVADSHSAKNLVTEIDNLAARCQPPSQLPKISLEDCTLVVWCVLLVWASRVPHGESEDFEEEDLPQALGQGQVQDNGIDNHSKRGQKNSGTAQTRRSVSLIDLPQLMAFS